MGSTDCDNCASAQAILWLAACAHSLPFGGWSATAARMWRAPMPVHAAAHPPCARTPSRISCMISAFIAANSSSLVSISVSL
jgi:hypothetical protein